MTVLVRIALGSGRVVRRPDRSSRSLPACAVTGVAAAVARRTGISRARGRSSSPGCSRPVSRRSSSRSPCATRAPRARRSRSARRRSSRSRSALIFLDEPLVAGLVARGGAHRHRRHPPRERPCAAGALQAHRASSTRSSARSRSRRETPSCAGSGRRRRDVEPALAAFVTMADREWRSRSSSSLATSATSSRRRRRARSSPRVSVTASRTSFSSRPSTAGACRSSRRSSRPSRCGA